MKGLVSVRRSLATACLVAVLVGLGLVAPSAASAQQPFADAASATITPGVLMLTPLEAGVVSACTASFVFRGGGAVYLSYAAHCAGGGGSMGLSGCEEPTLLPGSPVVIEGRDGAQSRGTLAYSSWATMQEEGETDPALCLLNDFALVEVAPDDVDLVNPSVPVLGGPTDLDVDGTVRGEPVFSYQPNVSGPAVKQGVSLGDDGDGRTHVVATSPPGQPGDSGGGYLDADGDAFGLLSTRFPGGGDINGVTDVARALAYANQFGGLGGVSLVPGTEPFILPGSRA